MNNNNENISVILELSKQIETLQSENYELRQEISRLSKLIPSNNEIENKNSELLKYYVSRYDEIHSYVLENRIKLLDEDIAKAQESYDKLIKYEESIGEIASKNASIKDEVEALKEEISLAKTTFDDERASFEMIASSVTDQENNLYKAIVEYYDEILTKLSIGNISETIDCMNFIMNVLQFTIYPQVVTFIKDANLAIKKLDDLTYIQENLNDQLKAKEERIAELELGLVEISYEENERKLDSIVYEMTNKKQVRNELVELFETLAVKNKKHIENEIDHFRILQMNNQQIATKLDEILLEYKDSLSTADTDSNILLNKKIKLNQLNQKMQEIHPVKEELNAVKAEYDRLQTVYQTVTTDIDNIEKYIVEYKKLVSINSSFKKIIDEYDRIQVKIKAIQENKEAYLLREKNLTESRKKILNNPYGKTDLIKIDNDLKLLQDDLRNFEDELTALSSRLYQLRETEQDFKVINVYENCLRLNKTLPLLTTKQADLSSLISEKFIIMSELKNKCLGYDELKKQIEALEDEIKNF